MIEQLLPDGRKVVVVHLERGGRVVCMPGLRELHATTEHPAVIRTDDLRAVTCPTCRRANGG